jgi:signal transduction histidine kinase
MSGGERMSVRGDDFYVEIATTGDPAGARWRSYAYEIYEDVLSPMVPLALLLLGVAVLTIRWSMRPLAEAARKAESITVLDKPERFDLAGLPRETASFALAINRLLERVGALIESQGLFIARAAHELRTPLAIMLLELGKIGDDRARRLETDVTAMGQSVARLLTLAKLKALHEPQRAKVDIVALAEEVVSHMKAWAAERGHELNLATLETGGVVMADRTAIREALRNLIENAVTHTPVGTRVDVTLTPTLDIVVEDNGPGLGDAELAELLQPFQKGVASSEGSGLGLAIVAQAVDLHSGSLDYARSASGGARFVMKLGAPPSQ